jgi:hypothetical protein
VELTLLTAPLVARTQRPVRVTWGGLLTQRLPHGAELVERWLDDGATAIALLDGATPVALGPVREAIDALERARLGEVERASARWWSYVERAAAMAPGGAAVWLRSRSNPGLPTDGLPPGFEWLVLERDERPQLPAGRFRLVVDPEAGPGSAVEAGRLLEDGGVLAVRMAGREGILGIGEAPLRLVTMDDREDPLLAILRKER